MENVIIIIKYCKHIKRKYLEKKNKITYQFHNIFLSQYYNICYIYNILKYVYFIIFGKICVNFNEFQKNL